MLLGKDYMYGTKTQVESKEYNLPFAEMGLKEDLREIKKNKEFSSKRRNIIHDLNMEEEIMGRKLNVYSNHNNTNSCINCWMYFMVED